VVDLAALAAADRQDLAADQAMENVVVVHQEIQGREISLVLSLQAVHAINLHQLPEVGQPIARR